MKAEVAEAMQKAHEARSMLRVGQITFDEAKLRVQPYIDLVNEGAKKMSKQYGNPFRKVSVTGFLR